MNETTIRETVTRVLAENADRPLAFIITEVMVALLAVAPAEPKDEKNA